MRSVAFLIALAKFFGVLYVKKRGEPPDRLYFDGRDNSVFRRMWLHDGFGSVMYSMDTEEYAGRFEDIEEYVGRFEDIEWIVCGLGQFRRPIVIQYSNIGPETLYSVVRRLCDNDPVHSFKAKGLLIYRQPVCYETAST